MNNIFKKIVCFSLTLTLATVISCSPPTITTTANQQNTLLSNTNNTPYTGAVSLKIDTGLIEKIGGKLINPRKVIDLDFSKSDSGFSIKSIPQGVVAFQETFTIPKKEDELNIKRDFKVLDTSKRYVLYIKRESGEKHGDNDDVTGVININNYDWLKNDDFKNKNEIVRDSLILNENNTLVLKLRGNQKSKITVAVVESNDTAGTIIRRSEALGKNATQKDHIQANDKNVFDPSASDLGLGGLSPYEGQTGEGFTKISVCLVNGVEEQILTGRMVVEFSGDYNTKLSTFLKRYNAILFNSFVTRDDTLMALVGLGDNPDLVNNISKNIQKTNQIASPSTESMTFSSIDALKTVAVYYDIFANSSDIVSGVSFNHPAYQQSVASFPIPATTSNTGAGVDEIVTNEESSTGTKSTDLEWLVNKSPFSPEITKAWSRSQGEDSVVAIIDSGFGTIDKYKDFKDRVIYKPELLINDYNEYKTYCQQVRSGQDPSKIKYPNGNFVFSTSDTNIDVPTNLASAVTPDCYPNKLQNKLNTACVYNEVAYRGACYNDTEIKKNYTLVNPPAHGFEVSSIIASTSDDFSHISGVAPKVKILPIAYNSKSTIDDYTFLLAISKVNDYLTFGSSYEKRKVDVISISTALSLQNSIWAHLQTFNCSNCINSTSVVFKKTGRLSNNPLEYYLNNFISYYSQDLKIPVVVGAGNNGDYADTYLPAICDDAITVGAYEIYNTNSTSSIRRASFPILNPFASSNYGKSVDLWANGRGTYTFLPQPNTSNSVYDFKSLQGSSFSTPIVAGVISLLKSWNKNLNGQDIKKILLERGYNLPINGDFRVPSGSNQKAINALASIIDIRVGAKKSITITGIYNSNNTVNPDSDNNSFYNTLKLTKDYTNLYSSFIGKKVTITGWLARDRNFINPSLTIAPIEDFELAQMKEKPSTNVPSRWYVRIYNIDDTGYAYVNLNNVATAYYSQDTGYIDVTSMISAGNNNFTFKTYNYSGGYTWGFQVKKDNNIVFNDISGSAGSYGANNNDQTKSYQYVYNHIITIDANGNVAANKNNLP